MENGSGMSFRQGVTSPISLFTFPALFFILLALPASLFAQLDQYGGRTDISCANATGHFILSKVNNRWWFCTPAGHVFISMDVSVDGNPVTNDCNGVNTAPIYAAKYAAAGDPAGTGTNWAWQQLKRLTSWGFNASGIT